MAKSSSDVTPWAPPNCCGCGDRVRISKDANRSAFLHGRQRGALLMAPAGALRQLPEGVGIVWHVRCDTEGFRVYHALLRGEGGECVE